MVRPDNDSPAARDGVDAEARKAHNAGHCIPEGCQYCLEIHDRRISRCRSCRAQIIWFKTDAGNNMPIDADTVAVGEIDLDLSKHTSHFATCPHADKHRRRRS